MSTLITSNIIAYLCPFLLRVSAAFSTHQKTAPSGRSRPIFPSAHQCNGCYFCPECVEAPPSPIQHTNKDIWLHWVGDRNWHTRHCFVWCHVLNYAQSIMTYMSNVLWNFLVSVLLAKRINECSSGWKFQIQELRDGLTVWSFLLTQRCGHLRWRTEIYIIKYMALIHRN